MVLPCNHLNRSYVVQYLLAVTAMQRIIKMHQYLLEITCVTFSEQGLLYRMRTELLHCDVIIQTTMTIMLWRWQRPFSLDNISSSPSFLGSNLLCRLAYRIKCAESVYKKFCGFFIQMLSECWWSLYVCTLRMEDIIPETCRPVLCNELLLFNLKTTPSHGGVWISTKGS